MKVIKFLFESCDTWMEKMIVIFWIIIYFIDVIFPIYFILNNIAVILSTFLLFIMGIIIGFIISIDIFMEDDF